MRPDRCTVKVKSQSSLESIVAKFTHERQRSIRRAIKGKTSAWLNVVPLESCHFDLAPSLDETVHLHRMEILCKCDVYVTFTYIYIYLQFCKCRSVYTGM